MNFAEFQRTAKDAPIVTLSEEIPADLLTPASVLLLLRRSPNSTAFLFESVEGGETVGRYSFIGADPIEDIQLHESGGVHRYGRTQRKFPADQLFQVIRERLFSDQASRIRESNGSPFSGGWVGYFGYDCIRLFERLPGDAPEVLGHPWVMLGLYDQVVVFDHARQTAAVTVSAVTASRSRTALRKSYDGAQRKLARTVRRLGQPIPTPRLPDADCRLIHSNTTRREFTAAVRTIKSHISRGDIFQGVLSQRFGVKGKVSPFDVYRRLRRSNPSPYLYYLQFDGLAIAGSSPETLVQKRGNMIMTRPIAGTRPRGRDERHDAQLARQLKSSPKENAEHVMLVDLGRNDLGRVSRPGTVETGEFCGIDRYSHVMHMVSTVTGRARRGVDGLDVLAAAFPAGTVSGAPKIRAMEIIDAIEPDRRGIYAGCVGYIDWKGDLDMAIAIRTAVMDRHGAYVQAGAGIVADSDPMREFRETQNKAAAPLAAIGGEWARGDRP